MKNRNMDQDSLYLWAKEDDVEKYTDYRNNFVSVYKLTFHCSNDIAKVVKHMYKIIVDFQSFNVVF